MSNSQLNSHTRAAALYKHCVTLCEIAARGSADTSIAQTRAPRMNNRRRRRAILTVC